MRECSGRGLKFADLTLSHTARARRSRRAERFSDCMEITLMALVRYEPWSMLNQLHNQINRVFDRELDQTSASSAATADWIPPADVEEYKDRFVLKLDVPGVDVGGNRHHARSGRALGQRRARDVTQSRRMWSAPQRTSVRPLPPPLHVAGYGRRRRGARGRSQRHHRSDDSEAAEGAAAPYSGRRGINGRRLGLRSVAGRRSQIDRPVFLSGQAGSASWNWPPNVGTMRRRPIMYTGG